MTNQTSTTTQEPSFNATPPAVPLSSPTPRGIIWLVSSILSWPLALFYVRYSLIERHSWAQLVFTLIFVALIEAFCIRQHREAPRESRFWAGCLILTAVSFTVAQLDEHTFFSFFFWHLFAIWYALCRTGMLTQRKTGAMVLFDGISGCLLIPFGNIFLRDKVFFATVRDALRKRSKRPSKQIIIICVSIFFALLFCIFAWNQLAAADDIFAAWGESFLSVWDNLFPSLSFTWIISLILSIPVGAWLYGLVGGGLNRSKPIFSIREIQDTAEGFKVLPSFTGCTIFAGLCGVYTLFFTAQILTCIKALTTPGFTAVDACNLAVQGFWQLCGIMVLNLAVLLLWRLFSKTADSGRLLKTLMLIFCIFGILFALLSALRLGIYTFGFGSTPKRIISGWWVSVLLCWAIIATIRPYKSFPAVRYALYYGAASCVVCCYLLAI